MHDLICHEINSPKGIKLVVEKAMNNPPMLNLKRPAVIRQYYGKFNSTNNTRSTYGASKSLGSVSVGTDPTNFITRKMTPHMTKMSHSLTQILKSNRGMLNLSDCNIDDSFNHCTVLLYYADDNTKRSSSMGYHSDCTYRLNDGKFDQARNCQVINTPTVVYTLGDTRSLNWKRRSSVKGDNGRYIWKNDPSWSSSYELLDGSVTIINPKDEDPLSAHNNTNKTQYLHGGVSVKGCQLSIGLVFRVVDYEATYDNETDRMITNQLHDESKYDKLYDNFDTDLFHSNLFNAYFNRFLG